MKTYQISVVCSDATTFSKRTSANTKREAEKFAEGVSAIYVEQGKNIFLKTVKLYKKL